MSKDAPTAIVPVSAHTAGCTRDNARGCTGQRLGPVWCGLQSDVALGATVAGYCIMEAQPDV